MHEKDALALAQWLQIREPRLSALESVRKLSGGAIQENWAIDLRVNGDVVPVVLRADAPSSVSESWGRPEEFKLLSEAFRVGVTVPEPLWLGDESVFGRHFFIMRRVEGVAAGHRLVKDTHVERPQLVRRIGAEMAKLHGIKPPSSVLGFLPLPEGSPVQHAIRGWRAFLDRHHTPFPALEWGIRWLELSEPAPFPLSLCHRDFRVGNFMVDKDGLSAVLDWEFAAWSDPREDLGWFCARCWRFGQFGAGFEAGGLASRSELLAGYATVSPLPIAEADLHFWEVYAHVRWAIIAIKQGERHVSGREVSLELALTAHIVPELEMEILRMTSEVAHA